MNTEEGGAAGGGEPSSLEEAGYAERQRGVGQEKKWGSSPRRCHQEQRRKIGRNPVLLEAQRTRRQDHVPPVNGRYGGGGGGDDLGHPVIVLALTEAPRKLVRRS